MNQYIAMIFIEHNWKYTENTRGIFPKCDVTRGPDSLSGTQDITGLFTQLAHTVFEIELENLFFELISDQNGSFCEKYDPNAHTKVIFPVPRKLVRARYFLLMIFEVLKSELFRFKIH